MSVEAEATQSIAITTILLASVAVGVTATSHLSALMRSAAVFLAAKMMLVALGVLPEVSPGWTFEGVWFAGLLGELIAVWAIMFIVRAIRTGIRRLSPSIASWVPLAPTIKGFPRSAKVGATVVAVTLFLAATYAISLHVRKSNALAAGRLNAILTWAKDRCPEHSVDSPVLQRLRQEQLRDSMSFAAGTATALADIEAARRVVGLLDACDLLVGPAYLARPEVASEATRGPDQSATSTNMGLQITNRDLRMQRITEQEQATDPLKWTPQRQPFEHRREDDRLLQELRALGEKPK